MSNAPVPAAPTAPSDGEGRKKLSLTRKPAPAPAARDVRGARDSRDAGRAPRAGGGGDRPRSGGGAGRPAGARDERSGGRDQRDFRDPRDARDSRGPRDQRDARDPRGDFRDNRDSRGPRGDGGFARGGDRPRDGERRSFGPGAAPRPAPSNVWRADAAPRTMQTAVAQAQNVQLKAEGQVRVNKRLSDLGMCSRREGDAWIENGWVLVNGEVATMGQLVNLTDKIEVNQAAQDLQDQQVTILLHKPMGYVSGQAEDGHEPAMVLLNPPNHWREDRSKTRFNFSQLKGLAPCGRLDIDSVGLLVLTQDGRIAKQIIGEESDMDKEYLVRVTYGAVDKDVQSHFPADKLALLCHGLSLDDQPLLPAEVDWQNPEQLRFVLREGKKRQIRRMCEQVGLHVVGLKRIRIGKVVLGNLPVGQWRYLGANEQF
ncbi:MAG: pseudouridine synthase [Comamonas sp.]